MDIQELVPPEGVVLMPSKINKRMTGAWCTTEVKKGTLFGPFKGEIVKENQRKRIDFRYAWEVYDLETNELAHIINATDPSKGDWTRYVNCARYLEEQNLVSVQEGMQVFYKAIRDIPAGEELLTWFERSKIRENKVIEKSPDKQNKDVSPKKKIKRTKSDSSLGLGKAEAIGEKRQRKKKRLYGDDEVSFTELIPKKRGRKLSDPTGLNIDPVCKENSTDGSMNLEKKSVDKSKKIVKKKGPKKGWKKEKGLKEGAGKLEEGKGKGVGEEKEKLSKEDEEKLAEIEKNWKYPPRHNEYQFEILGHFAISMNNRRMYKCDICAGLYRHTFSLKRHYLRNHINCSYLSKGDICNCMIVYPAQYLAMQKFNSNSIMEKVAKRLKAPKRKSTNENSRSTEAITKKEENENSELTTNSINVKENFSSGVSLFPGLYRCNVCSKIFNEKTELMSHTRDHPVLPDAKVFACPLCNMTFRFKMNLVRHQLVHQGKEMPTVRKMKKLKVKEEQPLYYSGDPQKPFGCAKCNMKFKYSSNLVKHEAVHSDLRPCTCSVCGKSFPTQTNLRKHMHVHSGCKVHCKSCDSVFCHVGGLRKHIRIAHPDVHRERLKKLLVKRGKLSAKSMALLKEEKTKSPEEEGAEVKLKKEEDAGVIEKKAEVTVVKKKRGRKPMSLLKSQKINAKDITDKIKESEKEVTVEEKSNSSEEKMEMEKRNEENIAGKGEASQQIKKEKKNKKKFEDGIDSRFKFSCVICKKRFTEYLNMCRHRRVAHENPEKLKYECGLSNKNGEKVKNSDTNEVVQESPEEVAAFYATVAYNIAENLNCYLDGGQDAVANCKSLIKTTEDEEVEEKNEEKEEIIWEQYNFPHNYNISSLSDNFEYDPTDPDQEKQVCKPKVNYFEIDENSLDDRSPAQCLRRRGSRESREDRDKRNGSRGRYSSRDNSSSRDADRDDSSSRDVDRDHSTSRDVDQDHSTSRDVDRDHSTSRDVDRDHSTSCDVDGSSQDVFHGDSSSQYLDGSSRDVHHGDNSSQDVERDFRLSQDDDELRRDVHLDDSSRRDVDKDGDSSQDVSGCSSSNRDAEQFVGSTQDLDEAEGLVQNSSENEGKSCDDDQENIQSRGIEGDSNVNLEGDQSSDLTFSERNNLSKDDQHNDSLNQNFDPDCKTRTGHDRESACLDLEQNGSNEDEIDVDRVKNDLSDKAEVLSSKLKIWKESDESKERRNIGLDKIAGPSGNKQEQRGNKERAVSRTVKSDMEISYPITDKEDSLVISSFKVEEFNSEMSSESEKCCEKSSESDHPKSDYAKSDHDRGDHVKQDDYSSKESVIFNSLLEKDESDVDKVIKTEYTEGFDSEREKCIMGQVLPRMMGNQREEGYADSMGSVSEERICCMKEDAVIMLDVETSERNVENITMATLENATITEEGTLEAENSVEINSDLKFSQDNKENIDFAANGMCSGLHGQKLESIKPKDEDVDDEKPLLIMESGTATEDKQESKELSVTERCELVQILKHSGDVSKSEENLTSEQSSHPSQKMAETENKINSLEDSGEEFYLKKRNFEFPNIKSPVPAEKKVTESDDIESNDDDVLMVDLFTDSDSNSNFCSNINLSSGLLFQRLHLSKGKLTKDEEGKIGDTKGDHGQVSPVDNYDAIRFGSLGDPVYVCSVCKRHYPDFDGLMRHQWKKHPSINCHFMEVEQGLDIEDLFYSAPCSRGILGTTGKALENVMSKVSYTCTRCKGSFKSPDRLRVHIVNCATPSPSPKKKKYYYYKRKTPTKQEGTEEESPSKKLNLKELNAKLKQLSDDVDQEDKRKKIAGKSDLDDNSGKIAKTSEGSVKVKDKKENCGKELVGRGDKSQPLTLLKTPEKTGHGGMVASVKDKTVLPSAKKKKMEEHAYESEFIMGEFTRGRRKKMVNQMYNPRNHVRRRELTEVLDKHQCQGCGVKFKSISLLERHVKKCDGKEKFKDLEVIKSHVNEVYHQKHKHACLYCGKNFTYPKTLMNHFKAFCTVKKEKVKKGEISQAELKEESSVVARLKQHEENRKFQDDTDLDGNTVKTKRKGGWPKGVKRKPKRKNHAWTYIKRRKSGNGQEKSEEILTSQGHIEDFPFEDKERLKTEVNSAYKPNTDKADNSMDVNSDATGEKPKEHGESKTTSKFSKGKVSKLTGNKESIKSSSEIYPFYVTSDQRNNFKSRKIQGKFYQYSQTGSPLKSPLKSPFKRSPKSSSPCGKSPLKADTISPRKSEAKASPSSRSISPLKNSTKSSIEKTTKSPLKNASISSTEKTTKSSKRNSSISSTKSATKSPSKDFSLSSSKSATKSPQKSDGQSLIKGAKKCGEGDDGSQVKRKIDFIEKDNDQLSERGTNSKKKQTESRNTSSNIMDKAHNTVGDTKLGQGETKTGFSEKDTKVGKLKTITLIESRVTSVPIGNGESGINTKSNFLEGISAKNSGKQMYGNEDKRKSCIIHSVNPALCSGGQSSVIETAANSFNLSASGDQIMGKKGLISKKMDLRVDSSVGSVCDNSNKKLTFHMYDGSSFVKSREKEMKLKSYDSKFHVLEEKDFAKKFVSKSAGKSARKLTELSPSKGEELPVTSSESSSSNQVQSKQKPVQINKIQSREKVVKMSSVVKRKPDKFVFHSANFEKK